MDIDENEEDEQRTGKGRQNLSTGKGKKTANRRQLFLGGF
jgi:hypothetical protein